MKQQYRISRIVKVVRYVVLSVILLNHFFAANAHGQNVKINLSFNNVALAVVMNEIKTQSNLDFVYNAGTIDENKKVSVNVTDADINVALKACLKDLGIDYLIKDNVIVLRKAAEKPQPQQALQTPQKLEEIRGRVIDNRGGAVVGATINADGTSIYAITDGNGDFVLKNVPPTRILLVVTYVGMKDAIYTIEKGKKILITMLEDERNIGKVIVTGMQDVKEEHMTGSTKTITAKDLRMQGITSIDRVLEGMVAGLNSTTVSGAPGTRAKVTIRGQNNLKGNTEPLWIVDGLPLMSGVPVNNTGDYTGTIMQDGVGNIMPDDIETITILKDASAAAIYGARAANGVIVITTKKGFRSKTVVNYNGTYEVATAPNSNINFMNSSEKLRYEKSIVDSYGLGHAFYTGRGGNEYRKLNYGHITPGQYNAEIARLSNINTDWFEEIFRTSHSHSHNISLRGGTEEMTYYTSVNMQQKTGVLKSNKYEAAGLLVKLDYRPFKNFIVALNVSANTRKNSDHASAIDPFKYAVFANPYERPYDDNGEYAYDLSYLPSNYTSENMSGYKYSKFNILNELEQNKKQQNGLDADLTLNLRYEVIKGLTLESILRKGVSYNTDIIEVNEGTYTSYYNESFARSVFKNYDVLPDQYDNGELSESSGRNMNWSIRNQIDYSFDIKEDHLFTVLVATETTSKRYNNFGYKAPIYSSQYRITGVPTFENNPDYETLRNDVGGMFNTGESQDRTVSFLGSFRYSFRDKYIFNFNARADGADVIGDSNRFTPLWSAGVRYNLHNERFFQNSVVTELSLRGSYGYTGNIDRTAIPFSIISFSSDSYMGNRYIEDMKYPNPSVKWEKKEDKNIGLDMSLFDGRIDISADYYSNRTKNILEELDIPLSTGRSNVMANGGVVTNKGYELYLNVRWVNRENFTFSTSFNVASNKNVIEKSLRDYKSYEDYIKNGARKGGSGVNIIGEETNAVYGWKVNGVNPVNGAPMFQLSDRGKNELAKFLDHWDTYSDKAKEEYLTMLGGNINRIPDYISDLNDGMTPDFVNQSVMYLGRMNPKIVGGFNTYIRYKNLEFTTQWTFKMGHIIPTFDDYLNAPNNGRNAGDGYSGDIAVSGTNRQKQYLDYWRAPGDVTNVRKFVPISDYDYWATMATSEKYEKGDYLRLTNLSLNYRLPSEFVSKIGMKNLSIGFNARNLLTFTKYRGLDVGTEGAFAYPSSREFNFKLSIGF